MDRLLGKLDNRTRLDLAPRVDVMTDASGHRAEGLAFVIPIRVDHANWHRLSQIHDELADAKHLIRAKGEFRMRISAHRTIRVIPHIMHPHVDQLLHPSLIQQIINIGLADAGGDAGNQAVSQAGLKPF